MARVKDAKAAGRAVRVKGAKADLLLAVAKANRHRHHLRHRPVGRVGDKVVLRQALLQVHPRAARVALRRMPVAIRAAQGERRRIVRPNPKSSAVLIVRAVPTSLANSSASEVFLK